MTIIDISRTLNSSMAVWPGDTPFQSKSTMSRRRGDAVNVSALTLSTHIGSHMDAPYHFDDDGDTLEQLELSTFWGAAQLVTVNRASGPLTPADFAGHELGRARRLLVHTAASHGDPEVFSPEYAYPSPELAEYLGAQGVILYGTDAPSMDAVDDPRLPGHNALLRNGVAILEGLWLQAAPDGMYELVALPLKIDGGDGSPVRAALRPLSY